jgi:inner membrane protein
MALCLVILYTFLFTVLQLQDYALLLGSVGLFLALGVTMYLSRNINWYASSLKKKDNQQINENN